jgi:hypothetical protein
LVYEEISEDEYLSSIAKVRPISSLSSDTSTIEEDCLIEEYQLKGNKDV